VTGVRGVEVGLAPETVETVARELRHALGPEAVVDDGARLDDYTADTYWKALAARAGGTPLGRPDLVVFAGSEEDVAVVVRVANRHRVPVVPWGGGSGSQGGAVATEGGIALDLNGLDRILEIDETSLTVTAEAGVNGRTLEQALNERGLMFPHYPASADLATVGGYVAARGSGVLSTRYGKIEDLVLSLRVVTPSGDSVDMLPVPRHAVGPELTQLYVGSEGAFGVITRATLQIARVPAARRFEAAQYESVAQGIAGIRDALARGLRPSVVRLYDEAATRQTLAAVVGEALEGVCAVFCFEGEPTVVDAEAERMLELVRAAGARVLGQHVGSTWWERRYDFYVPPHLPVLPAVWGTIEAVATYRNIEAVYDRVREAMRAYEPDGLSFKAHFSHWYPWGTMMYGRFIIAEGGPEAIPLHDRIWAAGVRAILEAGGLMNDHHGVGIKLAPYMEAQHGAALETLRRIKEVLDPNRIMNPGKLGL
jgi:alkyldihydroxyacetonephosphate synthase